MGKDKLSSDEPYASINAYAMAIWLEPGPDLIEAELETLEKLQDPLANSAAYLWVQRFLMIAKAVQTAKIKGTAAQAKAGEIKKLVLRRGKPIQPPVTIVAGGCDSSVEEQMQSYRQMLYTAFSNYRGTVISGGTEEGISGLVGDLGEKYPDSLYTIGYLPGLIPDDSAVDSRYRELNRTEGSDFSPLESLQYWIDIIASGHSPAEVKLLGINGGNIAAAEFTIALALGAAVGLIADSGREADRLLADEKWNRLQNLFSLPSDALKIKAFIDSKS